MAKLPIDPIQNNEEGLSVRNKLNTLIDRANTLDGIENHLGDTDNPHKVKAPQVALEPVLAPLDDQNVQAALEFLFGRFTDHDGDWHLTHIDGNYIELGFNPLAVGSFCKILFQQIRAVGAIIQVKENEQLLSSGLCILNVHWNFKKGLLEPARQFVMHGFGFNVTGKCICRKYNAKNKQPESADRVICE